MNSFNKIMDDILELIAKKYLFQDEIYEIMKTSLG